MNYWIFLIGNFNNNHFCSEKVWKKQDEEDFKANEESISWVVRIGNYSNISEMIKMNNESNRGVFIRINCKPFMNLHKSSIYKSKIINCKKEASLNF